MFGGIPKTTRDLLALVKDWHSNYTGHRRDQELLQRDIIRRVHAAGGYDLVGTFAKLVGIPRKRAIVIARQERARNKKAPEAEAAALAQEVCAGRGEVKFRRSDTSAKTRAKKARRLEIFDPAM